MHHIQLQQGCIHLLACMFAHMSQQLSSHSVALCCSWWPGDGISAGCGCHGSCGKLAWRSACSLYVLCIFERLHVCVLARVVCFATCVCTPSQNTIRVKSYHHTPARIAYKPCFAVCFNETSVLLCLLHAAASCCNSCAMDYTDQWSSAPNHSQEGSSVPPEAAEKGRPRC